MNLSDKITEHICDDTKSIGLKYFKIEDIKIFIKEIKDLLGDSWYMDCVKDEIDKLAGSEFVQKTSKNEVGE